MPTIKLETIIQAPIERCFDLSRSIDLHTISTQHTGERAISGKVSGLINLGEQVTWRAKHFGVEQELTTKIIEFVYPQYFCDEMLVGVFKNMRHEHHFQKHDDKTQLIDIFHYECPCGIMGRIFDRWILNKYMQTFLIKRNNIIKEFAESDQWKKILPK